MGRPLTISWTSQNREYAAYLMEYPEDAAGGPDVDADRVTGGSEQDLWSSVPAGGDVVGQHGGGASGVGDRPAETEVAHFDVAVGVEEDVGGLDVSVEELGRVKVLESLEQLPGDVLLVNISEDACSYHSMEVCLHMVKGEVDVSIILSLDDMLKTNDILVAAEQLQVHDFPEGPLGVHAVSEGVEALLQGHHGSGPLLDGFPHHSVGTLAQSLTDLELTHHMSLDVLAHRMEGEMIYRTIG